MRLKIIIVLVLSLAVVAGCMPLGYYLQSARGQIDLMSRREPIDKLITDPATEPQLRARLQAVAEMREFASTDLKLPDNRSYRSYADLGRPFVVWNVFAAPALSVEPHTWCFPFVGCIAYRGYFAEANALNFARRLERRGDDVYVAGITAYSTLGHFADPVLNTMLRGDDVYLAGIVFHELAHQLLYIRDATGFNEAFASLVEEEGVRRWLTARDDGEALLRWQSRQQFRAAFGDMVSEARERLARLYDSALGDAQKLERKQQILARLRAQHESWRERLGADTGYEAWFAGPLNNAQLASVATYRRLVPAFRLLLDEAHGDMDGFYARVMEIAELPAAQRDEAMEALLARSSGSELSAAAVVVEASAPRLVTQ